MHLMHRTPQIKPADKYLLVKITWMSVRLSLMPLYRTSAKIGLKDFQVKTLTYLNVSKFLQVFFPEASSVFSELYSRIIFIITFCYAKNKSVTIFSGKEERMLIKNNNKSNELFNILSCVERIQIQKE